MLHYISPAECNSSRVVIGKNNTVSRGENNFEHKIPEDSHAAQNIEPKFVGRINRMFMSRQRQRAQNTPKQLKLPLKTAEFFISRKAFVNMSGKTNSV